MEYFAYSQKAFAYKYVVMLSDTDQFKHMSFANYLKLMFLATDALFVSCFDAEFLSTNRLRLVTSKMQFKKQTIAGDNILIKVNAAGMSTSQFSLLFTFIIEGTAELVGLGRQNYEVIYKSAQSVREVPDCMKDLLLPIVVDEGNLLYKY